MASSAIPWLVVGVRENRRTTMFCDALAARGFTDVTVLDALDALAGPEVFEAAVRRSGGALHVRLDSPGEDFEATRRLLELGAEAAEAEGSPSLGVAQVRGLEPDRGLILLPRQWYLGFVQALGWWQRTLEEAAPRGVRVMSWPDEAAVMFDKVDCQALLEAHGVPIPPRLGPVDGYEAVVAAMEAHPTERAFIKLAHGSSASGVIAYSRRGERELAVTSMERVAEAGQPVRFYNSLRLSHFTTQAHVKDAVDFVCRERAQAEVWVPKATVQGSPFDLRVVVICGRACHVVMRVGRSPMTNLHLGNARGDVDALRAQVGEARWGAWMQTCEAVAAVFPRSLYFGVDLAVSPDGARCQVLEVNAFGDLLPRVLWSGQETHGAEIDAALAAWSQEGR